MELLLTRICRSCGAAGSQKPNGSYLCLKCDPSVSYQEFIALVRANAVSNDLHLRPSDIEAAARGLERIFVDAFRPET